MKWYSDAFKELLAALEDQGRLNGRDFLEDFVLAHREEYFEDLEYDEIDQFVSDQFDDFQTWLDKQDRVNVLANGKWQIQPKDRPDQEPAFESPTGFDDFSLSDEENRLLSLEIYQISSDHYEGLKKLYARLSATNLFDKKYDCAFRLAVCGERCRDVLDVELIECWENASDAAQEAGFREQASKGMSEAAYHCLRISKYEKAGRCFEDASEMLEDGSYEKKAQLLRNSRIQYQMVGDHDAASRVFVEEKRLESKNVSLPVKISLFLYRMTSDYGESPSKVIKNIVVVLVMATLLAYWTGIKSGSPFFERLIDCFYYSVITFTTLGYGDIYPVNVPGKVLAGGLAMLGLLYTSLLMVTVVKRYGRA